MMSSARKSWWRPLGLVALVLTTAGLGLRAARVRGHDEPERSKARVALRQTLKEKLDGQASRVTLVEVEIPPGGAGQPHRHPGPVIGYVLQGAVEMQVDDGPLKTYRAGEAFYEPARALHKVSRNASQTEPARFLAYMLTRDDETRLVLPPD